MIDERLQQVFRDVLGDQGLELSEGTTARDVEGWDSLAHINLMVSVEGEFGVSFTSAQLTAFQDVGALQRFLTERGALA
ncbi:acyl carrier protein [Vallicoccus soli]|uniref:Acyl carrier protein n=1 Tax=Vallicoccus soli TaxID=2339232 RepID=A0A3A3ZMH8_9ACTN|nr:acyl carrier protein [Vallicoccus soli]RJK97865.1 acyl carrier protein [Vallicoccus soli]